MKGVVLAGLLAATSLVGQQLEFQTEQLLLGGNEVSFLEMSKEMKEAGNQELAKAFRKVHRRKSWRDESLFVEGVSLLSAGLYIPGKMPVRNWVFKGILIGSGVALVETDNLRKRKTQRLAVDVVARYNALKLE